MNILDSIRQNGQCYHYRIASGIEWLILAFPGDQSLPNLLNEIAALPDVQSCKDIANQTLGILKSYYGQLDSVRYSSVFTVLNEALTELG